MAALLAATAVAVACSTASISATAAGPPLARGVVLAKAYVKNHYRIDSLYGVTANYAGVGAKAIEPKIRVPCDIWPPFAEAMC